MAEEQTIFKRRAWVCRSRPQSQLGRRVARLKIHMSTCINALFRLNKLLMQYAKLVSVEIWRHKTTAKTLKKSFFSDNKHWSELNACGLNYRGLRPFSEPETRAVASFLRRHQRSIIAYISYHSFGQMWMLPYGYSSDVTSKHELLMVRCMRHNAGNFEWQ